LIRGAAPVSPLCVLVIGASYGLLAAAKIAASGHAVTVVGRPAEIAAITRGGVEIEFPGGNMLFPPLGAQGLRFADPAEIEPDDYDMVFLAVQATQVQTPEIAGLLHRIGGRLPIASLMNLPPPPFLERIETLPAAVRFAAMQSADVWAALPPDRMTMAAPDPQAFRPDPERPGALRVTLASNFKFAPFARPDDQMILARIARDVTRLEVEWGKVPVHMLARTSIFVPLAKWPMLVTGNCRSLSETGEAIAIATVLSRDPEASRTLYECVNNSLIAIGAPVSVLVPFEAYLSAGQRLLRPSSLANAISAGARDVERIDLVVLELLRATSAPTTEIQMLERISDVIARRLAINRAAVLS
jgi:hypothetical protein